MKNPPLSTICLVCLIVSAFCAYFLPEYRRLFVVAMTSYFSVFFVTSLLEWRAIDAKIKQLKNAKGN